MDIFIHVPRVNVDDIAKKSQPSPTSVEIREQVIRARDIQLQRFAGTNKTSNAEMTNTDIEKYCVLNSATKELLEKAVQKLDLSTRAYYRILRLARTIADLSEQEEILPEHITEALSYRDRQK